MSEMLKELAQNKEAIKEMARNGGNSEGEELPRGASSVTEDEETSEVEAETSEETPVTDESEASIDEIKEPETLIRIGGREFKTQSEAIRYAEELEREKLISDSHTAGVREALEATRAQNAPEPEVEEDFDAKFYADPKGSLKEVKAQAVREAIDYIKAETNREKLWGEFLDQNPDIRRKDAERILNENMSTIGKMTDYSAAMKLLAQKVRSEYDEITEARKPRTELKNTRVQAVSPSGGSKKGVTPQKNEGRPLSFSEELRQMKSKR